MYFSNLKRQTIDTWKTLEKNFGSSNTFEEGYRDIFYFQYSTVGFDFLKIELHNNLHN